MNRRILYIVYGIIITVLFVYLLFPSEAMKKYIITRVSAKNPNVLLAISDLNLGIPAVLKFEDVIVRFKDKPGALLEAEAVNAWPRLLGLLKNKLSLRVSAKAYEGDVEALILFLDGVTGGNSVNLDAEINQIDIGKCSYITKAFGRRVKGILSGTVSFNGKYDDAISGEGTTDLVVKKGSIQLLKSMFGFDEVTFDEITADMDLKNRTVKVNGVEFGGKDARGSFNGTIILNRNIARSRLSLRGTVEIPAFNRTFSTFVSGTLNNPVPRLK